MPLADPWTMSGLDTTWAALAILWALALVGAYEFSSRRTLSEATTVAPEEPTTTSGRGY